MNYLMTKFNTKSFIILCLSAVLAGCASIPENVDQACTDKHIINIGSSGIGYVAKVDSININKSKKSNDWGFICDAVVNLSNGEKNVPGIAYIDVPTGDGSYANWWETNLAKLHKDRGISKYGKILFTARQKAIKNQYKKYIKCEMRHPGWTPYFYVNPTNITELELDQSFDNIENYEQSIGPRCEQRYISHPVIHAILSKIDKEYKYLMMPDKVLSDRLKRTSKYYLLINSLAREIQNKVYKHWNNNFSSSLACDVEIRLNNDGKIANQPQIVKSSGNSKFDKAAISAIEKASPFTPPAGLPYSIYKKIIIDFKADNLDN